MGEEGSVISNGILVLLMILFLGMVGGYFLKKNKVQFLQEAGLATLLGILFGGILEYLGEGSELQPVTRLNVEFFLLFLLPPIIFESGYNMDKDAFFANFGPICSFAFLGTFISALIVSSLMFIINYATSLTDYKLTLAESFAFGSLISATDPVSVLAIMKDLRADRTLYNLVFGESIFNDAVTISLYRAIIEIENSDSAETSYLASAGKFLVIFSGSFLVGAGVALIVSYLLRKLSDMQQRVDLEAAAVIFGPWVSYLLSEALSMSGIVSILFCGIFMARYTHPNLSETAQGMVGKAYSVIGHCAETLVFIFLGMGLFSFSLPYE